MEQEVSVSGDRVLADEFLGKMVRVYLVNGAIISGKLIQTSKNAGYIYNPQKEKASVVTWRHVISITRY